jgi:F-type H+-transporting ATPase subunit delta
MFDERAQRDALEANAAQPEVGVERVAAVYAEAFLGAAAKEGPVPERIDELDSLVADVLDQFPALETVLASGLVAHEEKVALLDRLLGSRASPHLLRFLKVVSRHGRLDCLRAIRREVHRAFERMQGRVSVRVTTATPLEDAAAGRLVDSLRKTLEGEPVLQRVVDPGVLGGVVVRVGDTIYDASLAAQLESLRQQILDRSAHEIQSRRDRFRHPG